MSVTNLEDIMVLVADALLSIALASVLAVCVERGGTGLFVLSGAVRLASGECRSSWRMSYRIPQLCAAITVLSALGVARTGLMAEYSGWVPGGVAVTLAVVGAAAWLVRSRPGDAGGSGRIHSVPAWVLAAGVGAAAFNVSYLTSRSFGDLPPALHDEYSYLFQANTFLDGRLSSPGAVEGRRLFDQIHVLNVGRFASRYFPGTGLWIAPFLLAGAPYLGHRLAAALAAMLVFGCGCELAGRRAGFFAGMVLALSPGMAIFSNLLTASQPCLLGLTAFLFCLLRLRRTPSVRWALLSGAGLAFAMLCRPLTAAGMAAPFGLWFIAWLWNNTKLSVALRFRTLVGLGGPVLGGLLALGTYNHEITGDVWKTPHALYNEIYTPCQSYGYHNVVRGEPRRGPAVDRDYDEWAVNLTLRGSLQNAQRRLVESWTWTIGILPVCLTIAVMVRFADSVDRFFWLIPAAILTLHLAYLPYWFAGTLGFHYVYESIALCALVTGIAADVLLSIVAATGRRLVPVWLALVAIAAVAQNLVSIDQSRPSVAGRGIETFKTMRIRHAVFLKLVEENVRERPAVVYVPDPPMDLHVDFVLNDPALDRDVLFARWRDPVDLEVPLEGRVKYVFDERHGTITKYVPGTTLLQPGGASDG